jgi:hypothetical protein
MEKDQQERRYRKSPGRQYGYDYDPLRSQSGSASNAGGSSPSRSGALLIQRPDPRRTRQLMRQNIIASKRSGQDDPDMLDDGEIEPRMPGHAPEQRSRSTRRFHSNPPDQFVEGPTHRPASRRLENRYAAPEQRASAPRYTPAHLPATRELVDDEDEREYYASREQENDELEDPYEAYAAPRRSRREVVGRSFVEEREMEYGDEFDFAAPAVPREQASARASQSPQSPRASKKTRKIVDLDEGIELVKPASGGDDGYIYEEDEELPAGLRPVKKKVTRRGLLLGAGALVVGTAGVIAVVNVPHPSTTNSTGGQTASENQDEFNRGVTQGADDARKQLVEAMNNLEGVTLEGALGAAKLLQGTYDVIVSPVIHFGSTLSGDFLSAMLTAMKNARGYLAQVYQDNNQLASIQKVLEAWVEQVDQLPKQLDAITNTDLDGAQAYLQALQRKLDEEKKKLHATPTPTSTKNGTATPMITPTKKP